MGVHGTPLSGDDLSEHPEWGGKGGAHLVAVVDTASLTIVSARILSCPFTATPLGQHPLVIGRVEGLPWESARAALYQMIPIAWPWILPVLVMT